jgi:hypothetical protein
MDNLNIADIIKGAFEGKPADVAAAFNAAIQGKMADAIELKRQEISQSVYGTTEDEDDSDVEACDDEEDLDNLDVEDQPDEDL